ncbi:MAG: hypothetical protein LBH26_02780 [Treponema sp.]|jgi:hypothetical protein|nr:hypothetical protein [Treponema sp.]
MKTKFFRTALCFFFIIPAFLPAQTAERLDALLDSAGVSYAEAAMMVLPAAGLAGEDVSPETAFAEARARALLPKAAEPGGAVRLGDLAFLIMGAFGLKGGLFYTLFPGPRYAYRELVHRRLIQGRNDPALSVSGERLLRILSRVLDRHNPGRSDKRGYL